MALHLPTPLTQEILAYVLSPEEAFVYARLLPDNTFLRKLAAEVTLQQSARHITSIGWTEGISQLANESKNMDLNALLNCAASHGHTETMKLLRFWGAACFNVALSRAAENCHIAAMELLKSWGANDFNMALFNAADGGHIVAMKLLKAWGAGQFNYALCCAADGGHIVAMELLKSFWGF